MWYIYIHNYSIQEYIVTPENYGTLVRRVKCRNKGAGKDQSINQERFNSQVKSLSNDTRTCMCVREERE